MFIHENNWSWPKQRRKWQRLAVLRHKDSLTKNFDSTINCTLSLTATVLLDQLEMKRGQRDNESTEIIQFPIDAIRFRLHANLVSFQPVELNSGGMPVFKR